MSDPHPERMSMRGWGRWMGDLDQPNTFEEAQLHAALLMVDQLAEVVTKTQDIQMRLARIEIWIESNDPDYGKQHAPDLRRTALAVPESPEVPVVPQEHLRQASDSEDPGDDGDIILDTIIDAAHHAGR